VRVTGVIVAIDEFFARRIFTIDDSSGMCIECTCPAPPSPGPAIPAHLDKASDPNRMTSTSALKADIRKPAKPEELPTPTVETPWVPWQDIDVGAVVKIKGKPSSFREMKQVEIIKVEVMRSTEQEVRCWNEVLSFRKDVLRIPWVVSREAEEKCRRRAEKEQYQRSSRKDGRRRNVDRSRGTGEDKLQKREAERRENDDESDDTGRKRKEKHEQKKRRHKTEREGLDPENKVNYPSLAVRRRLAGKYDALGI